MELFKYKNYTHYKEVQIAGNIKKQNCVWVLEDHIKMLSEYIQARLNRSRLRGLCHGTRSGKEQLWFMKYIPGSDVIGTEISPLAETYPNTIQWDFHNVKKEWIKSFDFIYSNSFDHAFNPKRALLAWTSCLKDDGILIIEHSNIHEVSCELDPFGASSEELMEWIPKWTQGKYKVIEVIEGSIYCATMTYEKFLVIERTNG